MYVMFGRVGLKIIIVQLFTLYIMFGRVHFFIPGNNYYSAALGGCVLHAGDRTTNFMECTIYILRAVTDNPAFVPYHKVILDVQVAAISGCEFVETILQRVPITFFATERCKPFMLSDYRDNFVDYKPF